MTVSLPLVLLLAVLLFAIGAAGAVARRSLLLIFISIEIMFTGAIVALLAFARWNLLPEGMAVALFVLVVMAAEAAVGLALIVGIFRVLGTIEVDRLRLLRG